MLLTGATNTNSSFTGVDFLVIDFENGYGELVDSLINESESAIGYNFLNYNVESLETDVTSLEVMDRRCSNW